jgi:hypothetical protein
MKITDEILLEWSYRCHDGIVDLNDPKKLDILAKILKENNIDVIELNEGDETYDKVIKNALKTEKIPQVQGKYNLGKDVNINGKDAETFKALYAVAPPKKGKDIDTAGSKGTGNGEISMYWLFNFQPGHSAEGTQGGGKPDLNIDGKGVEVKAYDSSRITLGRFSSDKDNIDLLNTLFGLDALVSTIEKTEGKDKKSSSLNFSKSDISRAFNTLQDFSGNDDLRQLATKYPLINSIYSKVDNLIQQLGLQSNFTAVDAAGTLLKRILLVKFKEKPGFDGYIVNVSENGNLKYIQITADKINNIDNEKVLENTFINQGAIIINPEEIFKK